jgi:outer membrane receptor for ferrienterochelin and colicins
MAPKYLALTKNYFSFFLIASSLMAAEHSGHIAGKVTDKKSRQPMQAINVAVLGTISGAVTDAKGEFDIKIPVGAYSIRASCIGYRTVTTEPVNIPADSTISIRIEMEETALEFDPIVVLGGKTQQRLDQAAVSISVVTSKEIQRRNPTNIIEALESAPGVHFIGNQINIRGSSGYSFGAGNKVLLLLDGVPVYASDTGEFNWDMLPPLDIEQIEVLKGAGSTLWGASALGGVVNVITKDPTPDGKLLYSFSGGKYDAPYYDVWEWTDTARLYYEREDASYSKRFGPFGMRISAGRYRSTGYSQLGDFNKYNLTSKFDYRFKNNIKWTGYAAYSHIKRGFFIQWKGPNDPYEVEPNNLENRANVHQLNVYSKLAYPISARLAVNLRFSLVRSLMGNQFGRGADFNPAYGQGAEVQADWIPYFGHTVTIGMQYQQDKGSTKYFGQHTGYFLGPYLQDEWKLRQNLRLTGGFRYDRYQLIGDRREDLFSPRLGVNWQPWQNTSLRGSVGSGFRAATIVERFLELSILNFKIKANPDLKAERSWAYDFGLRQYFTKDWNIDVSFFQNDYWELIEAHLDLIRGQIQFRNIPRARIKGIEATSNWSMPVNFFDLNMIPGIQASITAMDHKDLRYDEPLTYRPKVIGNIKTSLRIGAFNGQMDYRYASRIEEVKIYPINKRVPMKFVDVRASYDVWKLTVQVGVNNLLQYNYAPMESNLMPMRTFTVGLKGEF